MSQKQPRLDSDRAVVGFGLLFACIALLYVTVMLGQPLSGPTVVQALLVGWFFAWVGLRVGDHLISRLVGAGRPDQGEATAVEIRPCTADELLAARVDGHLPVHAITDHCGTCGHLAVLATYGWTHYAVLDNHPVAPEAVTA